MTLVDAVAHARRWLANCAASPLHALPKPSLEELEAIRLIVDRAGRLARRPAASSDPLDWPDMSGCA